MAIWNKIEQLLNRNNTAQYEVIMLADKDGNILNTFGAASNIPIAAGEVTGYTDVHKFGMVDGSAGNTWTTVWSAADSTATKLYPWETTAGTLSVVSSSGEDEPSGQASQAKAELIILYDQLKALTATGNETDRGADPLTYGSETLGPGVYIKAGAIDVTGTLTLDADNDPNALFVFRTDGAFTTAAGAEVLLINGATSNNVYFVSEGASSTAANTIMRGSLLANQAAVSTGAGTSLEGRMLAINGAVTLGDTSIITAPTGTINSILTLGNVLALFNMFTGAGALSNAGASEIQLSIGTNLGAITGFETATVGGSTISGDGAGTNTGAYTITVEGLDTTYNPVSETFTLSGATETAEGVVIFHRVHRAKVSSGSTNVGTLGVFNGTALVAEIAPEMGQTQMCVYTIPAGKTGYLTRLGASSSKNIATIVSLFQRPHSEAFQLTASAMALYQNSQTIDFDVPLTFAEKTDLDLRQIGAANNVVAADFNVILVDNPV